MTTTVAELAAKIVGDHYARRANIALAQGRGSVAFYCNQWADKARAGKVNPLVERVRRMLSRPAPFDARKVGIERKRFSTTQGEVLLTYNGHRLEQYGDAIALRDGKWTGYTDAFLVEVAKRDAIERELCR